MIAQASLGALAATVANAATLWPVVPPLHAAGFAVLLVDARRHGRDDTTVPVDDARRLQAAGAGVVLLEVAGGHDLRDALAPHAPALVAFLQAACAAGCDNHRPAASRRSDERPPRSP
jgi:hypothetical protein